MPADHVKVPLGLFADRYYLRGPIDKGGSATVYLADDRQELCQVAVKVATVAEWDRRRWKRELVSMERLPKLDLPCVLLAKDAGEQSEFAYFVTDLCFGGSLHDRVRDFGALSPVQALRILEQLAPVLDRVHEAGLVHRDIKPANILFPDADPTVFDCVLSDWGIARYVGDETLTTSLFIGTERYMSRQRRAGEAAMAADDQYGLGQTLEDVLRGNRHGDDRRPQSIVSKHAIVPRRRQRTHPERRRRAPASGRSRAPTCGSRSLQEEPASGEATEIRLLRRGRPGLA